MRVILAPSLELATSYLNVAHLFGASPVLTIEAEYGGTVVRGSRATFAEHQATGPFAEGAGPAPCNDSRVPQIGPGEVILVSHYDLDTAGACLRSAPEFADLFAADAQPFWTLAEYIDGNGAHRLDTADAPDWAKAALRGFWAWSRNNVPRFARDRIEDVTHAIMATGYALRAAVLRRDALMAHAGEEARLAEQSLNEASLMGVFDAGVIARVSEQFVNHLYNYNGDVARAVVARNTKTGAITVSLESPVKGVSCRNIVQQLWGPEAGGKDGIAGSPRGRRMTDEEFRDAIKATEQALTAAS